MSRKIINPKDFFNIIYLHEVKGVTPLLIKDKVNLSQATIYRILNEAKGVTEIQKKWKNFIKSTGYDFNLFMAKFWSYFPYPEFWPQEILCRMINYSAQHNYKEIHLQFEIKFDISLLIKLFESGKIKEAAKDKCHDKVKKQVEIKELKKAPEKTIQKLIEELKLKTGAKEVILKF